MIRGTSPIGARYADTRIAKKPNGKRVLINLPNRREGELREIKKVLSSYHCRFCAKCCSGGFSIGREEEHYERIMKLMKKRKKHYIVEKVRGKNNVYYEIGVPRNRNSCGFLSWDGGELTHRTLLLSDGRDREAKPFSCGIYAARASVCIAYPVSMAWMHLEMAEGGKDEEGTAILDAGCPAIMELVERGIGHLLEREIISLSAETDVGIGSLLHSFPASTSTVNRRMKEIGKECRVLVNEEGEKVYPVNSWEIFL